MTILERIMNALDLGPKGPKYSLEDLIFHDERYRYHIEKSMGFLRTMLSDPRWTLIMKDPDGEVKPLELLSKIKWSYLPTIRSWTVGEFIPKIRKFSNPRYIPTTGPSSRVESNPTEIRNAPLANGRYHFEASKRHAKEVSNILRYFLCDFRSPFDQNASLDDGNCSAFETCKWYVGGSNIVDRNIERIENNLTKYIEFARKHT